MSPWQKLELKSGILSTKPTQDYFNSSINNTSSRIKHLYFKGHCRRNEKITYRKGENIRRKKIIA